MKAFLIANATIFIVIGAAVGILVLEHGTKWVVAKLQALKADIAARAKATEAQATTALASIEARIVALESMVAALRQKVGL